MFGLGMGEILVLAVLGLILIGPEQLPELARTLGRFINDLKRTTEGLTDDIKKQAKVDIDLDFMNPNKTKTKPFTEEEYKKLIQPPAETTLEINDASNITNSTEPHHGKKMTHNEFGELIIEPVPVTTTEATPSDDSKQLALFDDDTADKKNSNS